MLADPKEVFVYLLSEARQNNEKAAEAYTEISQLAQDHPQIKELLEARAYLALKTREHLDHCFKLIGERPVVVAARHHEIFLEELRKRLAEIKSPVARHHFILAKLAHLNHIRIGEYEALIAADVTGHHGVGVLLEGAKAARVAFAERTRHLARRIVEAKMIERKAAERAA
jgi:ferritin-like metal-binding protein YciE